MKKFKFTSLALATTLAFSSSIGLVGCGSDNDNDNTASIQSSETQQAKDIINTARTFISDSKVVEAAYTNVSDIFTEQQSSRLSYVTEIPTALSTYMFSNEISELNAVDINVLNSTNDPDFIAALDGFTLTPESDFIAKIDIEGKFTLSGTSKVVTDDDNFNITYDAFSLSGDNNDEDNLAELINISFKKVNFSSNANDGVILSAVNASDIVTGKLFLEDLRENFDIDSDSSDDSIFKTALTLNSLKLTANDTVIKASDFEFAALNIDVNTGESNEPIDTTLPYTLKLTGNLKKATPATDLAITLNTGLQEQDLKTYIANARAGNVGETNEDFIGIDLLLSIKGDVAKSSSATIPLDFQAQLERSAANVIELKNLTAQVNGKALFLTGKTTFDSDLEVVGSQLIIKQNNTSITLNLDSDNDFIKNSNGKLADILVNGRDYGDLIDDGNKIVAKFNDNSFIIL